MTRRQMAVVAAASGLASFGVLLVGVALVSIPFALILLGGSGVVGAGLALLYDPDRRSTP